jgi:murein DD-endopeptidase MepM/ murein hydrolase activator NlpD
MNNISKIILIFCIYYIPQCVNAQISNAILFKMRYNHLQMPFHETTDSTIREDYLTPDTLANQIIDSLCQNNFSSRVSLPLKKITLTSLYGYRIHPILKTKMFHSGVDISARREVVYAIQDGKVEKTGYSPTLGYYIFISHGRLTSVYGHLSYIDVKAKEIVVAGEGIAITGSTGRSTGEHLHFTLKYDDKFIDPWPYLLEINKRVIGSENMAGNF